ncbi:major facilitator superfamily domain-containing protein [Gamsiella multidivaricata]|uniref:major facilitator superfamily domain-containing protein n=1 Tax=Gamsiella multidivaricata TaxID=101098 RepID=UPI00221FBDF8|nr:major facilitator superfamily domain-containing protein [Gamsiella multidivaricata]KAI7828709.1 major facilitator superfamily domain-containing protein [Gamsiella multidivaricata]
MSNDFHYDTGPVGHRSSEEAPLTSTSTLTTEATRDIHYSNPIHVVTPHSPLGGRVRWAILAAACLVMFGNYYAFDNPASLNQPLQEYMQMSDETYAYFLNILYTSYSLPNIVLPWLGGYASDKFGHRKLLLFLSAMVAFGHLVVCLGVERRHVPAMILGRVLFGAGESLAVAQSAITVKYFRGKELAMALGINLCISRLGSVLNDVLTPYIWSQSSVPTAFWGGFVSCVLSFMTACALVWMDRRYGSTVASGFSRLPSHHGGTRFSIDTPRHSFDHSAVDVAVVGRYDPPSLGKTRKSYADEEIDMEVLHDTGNALGSSARVLSRERKRTMGDSDFITANGELNRTSRQGDDDSQDDSDGDGDDLVVYKDMTASSSPFGQCLALALAVFDYSQSFWVLFVMTFLLIGVQVPFNSIHAGFLQMRWYHNDPQKAAQIMTVPDLLSAVLVLPVGYFVDHYGQKSWLFMLCGLIIGFSHFVLGLIPISSPVPALMALGISSAIGAIITSAIPILVKSHQIATA